MTTAFVFNVDEDAGIVDQTPQLEQLLSDPEYEVQIEERGLLLFQRKE